MFQTPVILQLLAQLETERTRYEALVHTLTTMRREGFRSEVVAPHMTLPTLHDAVRNALHDIPEEAMERVRAWAWEQQMRGADPESVAAQIRNGA